MPDNSIASAGASDPTSAGASSPATYRGMRIRQLQQEISELSAAVTSVLTTGISYTLSNSHSVTRANVSDIQSQLQAKKSELAALLSHRQFHPLRMEPTKFY